MALAQRRGWKYGNYYALIQAAEAIAEEQGDRAFRSDFSVAKKFHANFYHDFMEEHELEFSRSIAIEFVARMLALVDDEAEQSMNGLAE